MQKINFQIKVISIIFCIIILSFINCADKHKYISEELMLTNNDATIYVKKEGKGENLVILHGGAGLDHTYLLPQFMELSNSCCLIFYDQRGTGRSTAKIDSVSITVDNFISDIEAIRKELDQKKINLLGHSWGGSLAIYYAIKHPEHVNSLILLSSAPATSECSKEIWPNIEKNITEEDGIALERLLESPNFKNSEVAEIELFKKILFRAYFYNRQMSEYLNIDFCENTAKNGGMVQAILWKELSGDWNLYEDLLKFDFPVLLIHGRNDPIPVNCIEEMHSHLPNSQLHIIENCGHFPYVEAKEETFKLISEFIDNI